MSVFINETTFYKELFAFTKQYESNLLKEPSTQKVVLENLSSSGKKNSLSNLKNEYEKIENVKYEKKATLKYLKDIVIKTRTLDHVLFAIKNNTSLFYKIDFFEDYITNNKHFICKKFNNLWNMGNGVEVITPNKGILIDFYSDMSDTKKILLSLHLSFDEHQKINFETSRILFCTNSDILNSIASLGLLDNENCVKELVNRNKKELIMYINQFINLENLTNYMFAFYSISKEVNDFEHDMYKDTFFHNELKYYESFIQDFKEKKEEFHLLYDVIIKDPCIVTLC